MNRELSEAFERARTATKERRIREAKPRHIRNEVDREKYGAWVEVRHPDYGSIRVKARSNFDAMCAAEEKLGLEFLTLRECEVWAVE